MDCSENEQIVMNLKKPLCNCSASCALILLKRRKAGRGLNSVSKIGDIACERSLIVMHPE